MLNSAETRRLMTGGIGVGGRKLVHNYGIIFFFFLGGGGGGGGSANYTNYIGRLLPPFANYYPYSFGWVGRRDGEQLLAFAKYLLL